MDSPGTDDRTVSPDPHPEEAPSCRRPWYLLSPGSLAALCGLLASGVVVAGFAVWSWANGGFLPGDAALSMAALPLLSGGVAVAVLLGTGLSPYRQTARSRRVGRELLFASVGGFLLAAVSVAIALPNFLNGSSRLLFLHVRKDLRATAKAIESYRRDHGNYPGTVAELTTPVPYLPKWPRDRYGLWDADTRERPAFVYVPLSGSSSGDKTVFDAFALVGLGPDGERSIVPEGDLPQDFRLTRGETVKRLVRLTYDPTNGISSGGDLYVLGGK